MPVIAIQQKKKENNSFISTISIDGKIYYETVITHPFSEKQDNLLTWYYHTYRMVPFKGQIKSKSAIKSFNFYGENLFAQIFHDPMLFDKYNAIKQQKNLRFEIIGSPAFHSLYWEFLKDPRTTEFLSFQTPIIRRNSLNQFASPIATIPSPRLNILVISARPFHDQSQLLCYSLDQSLRRYDDKISIDYVRPGSYNALNQCLKEKESGYYHMLCLDVPADFLLYDQIKEITGSSFDINNKAGKIAYYIRPQSILFMEGAPKYKAYPISTQMISTLCKLFNIPIVILHVRGKESIHQLVNADISLRFLRAGIPSVLTLSNHLYPDASTYAIQLLCEYLLFDSSSYLNAVQYMRNEMNANKERKAWYDQTLALSDGFIPVIYQQDDFSLPIISGHTGKEQKTILKKDKMPISNKTIYRDHEMFVIEKLLFTRSNILTITGKNGSGKTTCLKQLRDIWKSSDYFKQIVWFDFQIQPLTCYDIVKTIAQQIMSSEQHQEYQHITNERHKILYLLECLNSNQYALIFDHFECLTGEHFSKHNSVSSSENAQIYQFIARLYQSQTFVIISSYSTPQWIKKSKFIKNAYEMKHLNLEHAADHFFYLLTRNQMDQEAFYNNIQNVTPFFKCSPLALRIIVPFFKTHSYNQLISICFKDISDQSMKNDYLSDFVSYIYCPIDNESYDVIMSVSFFSHVICQDILDRYQENLQMYLDWDFLTTDKLMNTIQDMIQMKMIRINPHDSNFWSIHPIVPLLTHNQWFRNNPDHEHMIKGIKAAFLETYDIVGHVLFKFLKSKAFDQNLLGQWITTLELDNLMKALHIGLDRKVSFNSFLLPILFMLDLRQNYQSGIELSKRIFSEMEFYSPIELSGTVGYDFVGLIEGIGRRLILTKKFQDAEIFYEKAIQLFMDLSLHDNRQKKLLSAGLYHQLGISAQEQRQWQKAEKYFNIAIQINNQFNQNYELGKIYHQLGRIAEEQRQWTKAISYLLKDLDISYQYNDKSGVTVTIQSLLRICYTTKNITILDDMSKILELTGQDVNKMFFDYCIAHSKGFNKKDFGFL